jgi:solute carrier family 25 carnitine/acylcarnitine transporter 20/29
VVLLRLTPPLVTATAANASIFCCHNYILSCLRGKNSENTDNDVLLSGICCGFVSGAIQCPTELIKIRLQVGQVTGSLSGVTEILRCEGFSHLFRGMSATLAREVPAFGCYFYSQKIADDILIAAHWNKYASSFAAGGLAGALSWIISYPMDVVKTDIQMKSATPRAYTESIISVFQRLVRKHGFLFLYRGLGTTIVRSIPVNAVVFPTHKFCSETLRDKLGVL